MQTVDWMNVLILLAIASGLTSKLGCLFLKLYELDWLYALELKFCYISFLLSAVSDLENVCTQTNFGLSLISELILYPI